MVVALEGRAVGTGILDLERDEWGIFWIGLNDFDVKIENKNFREELEPEG